MMDSLFEINSPQVEEPQSAPIRDEQVAQLRLAFEEAGITDQQERRAIVQSCVLRPVASLRELYATDARRVLKRISEHTSAAPRTAGASAWDTREEDTWIDKL